MLDLGKSRRMKRLFNQRSGKILLVPLDDSLLAGPELGLRNICNTYNEAVDSGADSILGFPGLFKYCKQLDPDIGMIINVTASTTRSTHTRKVIIQTVEQAIRIGADCIAAHVNIGSKYESEMLVNLGYLTEESQKYGIPLLGIIYPRTEGEHGDYNYEDVKKNEPKKYAEYVRHCVRIGAEIGVDMIKTTYTGNSETFSSVIESSMGIPIIIAGGPLESGETALLMAENCMKAGGSGISYGRNVFQRNEPGKIVKALAAIVHEGKPFNEAKRYLN